MYTGSSRGFATSTSDVQKLFAPLGREIPPAVLELVELLPFCGLSLFLLLTGDQIEALIETTADDESGIDDVVKTNEKKAESTKGAALAEQSTGLYLILA